MATFAGLLPLPIRTPLKIVYGPEISLVHGYYTTTALKIIDVYKSDVTKHLAYRLSPSFRECSIEQTRLRPTVMVILRMKEPMQVGIDTAISNILQ